MQFYDEFMLFVILSILIVACSYLKYLLTPVCFRARLQLAFAHQGRYWLPSTSTQRYILTFLKNPKPIQNCYFSRPEPDTEAQNQDRTVDNSKPPDYFEDLPPTYEEAMRMKNQEETSTKVILRGFFITEILIFYI